MPRNASFGCCAINILPVIALDNNVDLIDYYGGGGYRQSAVTLCQLHTIISYVRYTAYIY